MNNDGRDNKSLENLVDVILTKIAEELTGSRDKYLEYVMAEKGDGEWSSRDGSGFSDNGFNGQGFNGQGFNNQGFNAQGQGFNGNGPNPKGKKLGTVTKVIIGIVIAVLVLTLPIIIAITAYTAKTDTNSVEEGNIDEVTVIEEQEAAEEEEVSEDISSEEAESEENNPNIAAMAALMEQEPDIRMEYIDCFIRDMEYGDNNNPREITVVLKNSGNRIISYPSVSLTGVDEFTSDMGKIGAYAIVLPGQYICLNSYLDDKKIETLEIGSEVEVIYDAPWNYTDIPLDGAPDSISVQESMTKEYDAKAYPQSEISYLAGSIDYSDVGSDIGLEIADISIQNNHACVEIRNNTEYTIQEARVILCVLDENGNIIDSGCILYYENGIPSGETAKEYFPMMRELNERYVVPVFWDYISDADNTAMQFGTTLLKEIPKAVGL